MGKMPATGADAVVIDLEDATPPDGKAEGREFAGRFVPELAPHLPVLLRINDPSTDWYADDLAHLPPGLTAIVVPKVEKVDQLAGIVADLDRAGCECPIVAGIETALGVADSRSLLMHPRVAAAYFGAEDFIADMGGVRSATNAEVAMARSTVVLAARLGEVLALDQIVADFHDDERFATETSEARALGYHGKLCIHPAQVALANRGFLPSDAEVQRAERLLAAYDEAKRQGQASLAFEGQMVDEPVAQQARRLLAQADPS